MNRPNILIFMTDQQRGDSIYPYGKAITPHMDRFCEEGLSFSKAYTVSPHCCPARATFFSGLYPSQHGVWNNVDVGNTLSKGLYEGVRLFSEDLDEAGYDMYFSGKWHVSHVESPLDRGFHHMSIPKAKAVKHSLEECVIHHQKPDMRSWRWYKDFEQVTERREGELLRQGYPEYIHYGRDEDPFEDAAVVEDAVQRIINKKSNGNPWCHFVGTLGPHDPYFVPQRYLDMYDVDDMKLPDSFDDYMKDKPGLYRKTRNEFDQLSEREHQEALRHYLAFCTYEDDLFAKVLKALDESGEADNTLVLFLSDHGDYAAEHGLWCKGLPCFEGAYHIPFAMRWPEGIENPNRVVDDFISIADFAPTVLDVCGLEPLNKMTGRSLVPYLKNSTPVEKQNYVFTQSNGNELYGIQRSVRNDAYKFVFNGFDYDELYDLKKDPDEKVNLIAEYKEDREDLGDIIRDLSRILWKFAYETEDQCVNPYMMTALAPYGPGVIFDEK